MNDYMTEPTSSAAGFALIKVYGLKAVLGMIGSALLYFVLPPVSKDGRFNGHEFVMRLAFAGIFSTMFGPWATQLLSQTWPWLHAESHSATIELLVGAPGWWISRGIALWLQRREGKNITEIARDAEQAVRDLQP